MHGYDSFDEPGGRMLSALQDGAARTAVELARVGKISPEAARERLTRLHGAGVLSLVSQGPHRYYRYASEEALHAIGVPVHTDPGRPPPLRAGPRDPALRYARVCYDHLAGETAVRLMERLRARGMITGDDDGLKPTGAGEAWLEKLGIDVRALKAKRRPICKTCLDWSERRSHLAGSMGAALFEYLVARGMARRVPDNRAVLVSPGGETFLQRLGMEGDPTGGQLHLQSPGAGDPPFRS